MYNEYIVSEEKNRFKTDTEFRFQRDCCRVYYYVCGFTRLLSIHSYGLVNQIKENLRMLRSPTCC